MKFLREDASSPLGYAYRYLYLFANSVCALYGGRSRAPSLSPPKHTLQQ
jgi:hypothetical protein